MYDSFFKPTSDPKIIHFFITQSEKHTSAKFVRFKSLYKVYILGSPAAVVWEVPWGHWVFFEHGLCSSISSLKKNASRDNQRQLYASVSIATCPCLSFPARLTEVSFPPFVCVRLSNICLLICLLIYFRLCGWRVCCSKKRKKRKRKEISHNLTDNPDRSFAKTNHFLDLATADCSSR